MIKGRGGALLGRVEATARHRPQGVAEPAELGPLRQQVGLGQQQDGRAGEPLPRREPSPAQRGDGRDGRGQHDRRRVHLQRQAEGAQGQVPVPLAAAGPKAQQPGQRRQDEQQVVVVVPEQR